MSTPTQPQTGADVMAQFIPSSPFVAKLGIVSEEADESVFWLKRLLNAKIHSTTVELGPLYTPLLHFR